MARGSRWCAVVLLGLWVPRAAMADEAKPTTPPTPQEVRRTVDGAIGFLQTESVVWLRDRKCAACHHVAMTFWALGEADRFGYTIDRQFLADTVEAALGSTEKMIASKVLSDPAGPVDPRPSAKGVNIGAAFLAAAAWSLPSLAEGQRQSLRLITDDIVTKQRDDGSWEFFLSRPPINESQATDAAWIIAALQGEAAAAHAVDDDGDDNDDDALTSHGRALEKAITWLERAPLDDDGKDRQARVLRLLVGLRSGASREAMQPQIDELIALQHPDGGWGQTAGAASDAFATGQAAYALALAGYGAERAELGRAAAFLIATQSADGGWPMTSRATPDGKPGSATLLTPIRSGAAAWATLGLVRLAPVGPDAGAAHGW